MTEYNVVTKKQEVILYDTDKEIRIGDSVAIKIENEYDVIEDVDVNERVEGILDRIVGVCDRKNLKYFIKVLEGEDLNAISLPGGYVYIFKGLYDSVDNDDQLAGVIAHEVGHITAKHSIKRLQNVYGALMLQLLAVQTAGEVSGGVNLAINSLFVAYSQDDEFLADKLSVKYMKKAGYDPREMVVFLNKIKKDHEKTPLKQINYWKTHPNPSKRIAIVNQEINGKLEFKDYITLTEERF
ncbi:MAG: M48 family metalloprotease [Candidatus Omnitrophica bacterium]|nr:M48 family metalloprotease [Candidatus Omnitrophota bacterium]